MHIQDEHPPSTWVKDKLKIPVFTNLQNSNKEFENFPVSEERLFQNRGLLQRRPAAKLTPKCLPYGVLSRPA